MKRALYVGWIFSLILGVFAVLAWPPARSPKTSYFLIGLGVLVAIGLAIQLFRKKYDFTIALSMSIAGLSTGAALGFFSSGIILSKPAHMLLAMKWLVGAVVLNWMFRHELNTLEQPREPEAFTTNYALPNNYSDLDREQKLEVLQGMRDESSRLQEHLEATRQRIRRQWIPALTLLAAGIAFTIWSAVMK
ncbi:MAG: hypothetical protein KF836_11605 [Fimbriimonadaceae bacterium]|nr:hypothetical protein [Fimbriimonadaceae bacterium]